MNELVGQAAPALAGTFGVGPHVASRLITTAGDNADWLGFEAAFAKLCAACPIPASSGKTNRHRLNPGGDRRANNALYTVVLVRMRHGPRTRAYVARRTAEGKTRIEIMRCLKRFAAREIYNVIANPPDDLPTGHEIRQRRLQQHTSHSPRSPTLSESPNPALRVRTWPHPQQQPRLPSPRRTHRNRRLTSLGASLAAPDHLSRRGETGTPENHDLDDCVVGTDAPTLEA